MKSMELFKKQTKSSQNEGLSKGTQKRIENLKMRAAGKEKDPKTGEIKTVRIRVDPEAVKTEIALLEHKLSKEDYVKQIRKNNQTSKGRNKAAVRKEITDRGRALVPDQVDRLNEQLFKNREGRLMYLADTDEIIYLYRDKKTKILDEAGLTITKVGLSVPFVKAALTANGIEGFQEKEEDGKKKKKDTVKNTSAADRRIPDGKMREY